MSRYWISLFLFCHLFCLGQPDFRFHRYGLSQGLPSPNVRTIAEDRYGQIWFGTNNGLASFNGYAFTVFRNAAGSQPELASNDITAIDPLPNGDLLIGTTAGLHFFDHRKQRFKNLWDKLPLSYISGILPDGKGGFWISSSTGLYHSNHEDQVPDAFYRSEQADLYNTGIFAIYLDKQNRLWLTTSKKGFFKLDVNTGELKNFRHDPKDERSLSSNIMRQMASLDDGRLVLGTADAGYNVFDPSTEKFERFNHDPKNIETISSTAAFALLIDSKKNLWIGTWANGLNLIDPLTKKAKRFKHDPDDSYSISNNSVTTLFESSSKDIWIGTNSGGVSRLTPSEQRFQRFRHKTNSANSLSNPHVRAIHEDKAGDVWFGTNQGGLNRYDPVSNQYVVYLKPDDSRESLSKGTIWSISESPEGNIWFGTSRGVGQWVKATGQIKFIFYDADHNDPKKLNGNNILKVIDDQQGNLWVGVYYGGLNRVDIKTGLVEKFQHNDQDPLSIISDEINDIFIDSKQRLWIACDEGLDLFNPKTKTFKHFLTDKADPSIFHINEGKDGTLYLSTTEGLALFNFESEAITYINEAQGLGADHANATLIDDAGMVWIGTNNGIDRYNPSTKVIHHLTETNGLVANDTDGKACFKSRRNGWIYFGGTDGATGFDPATAFEDSGSPPVIFTGLSVLNKPVLVSDSSILKQSIHTLEELSLDYSDYVFAFEFAAMNYATPSTIQYEYTLQGFDKSWIRTLATDRKAVYTNVPAGSYTMKVRASNKLGQFNDTFTQIKLMVRPPWWKTWWARTLVYSVALASIILLIRGRIAFIKQQNKILEQQVVERTAEVHQQKEELEIQAEALEKANLQKSKLFSIIAHDLKSPLNSLKALVTLLDPQIITAADLDSMKQEINKRVEGVSDVMENLLIWASSQLDEERVKLERFNLNFVLREMLTLYTPIAEKKQITLKLDSRHQTFIYADINMVRAIMRNLISNAIKFTPMNGTVLIQTEEKEITISIAIRDSGIGMEEDRVQNLFSDFNNSTIGTSGERGIGLGLQVVHDFAIKLNGSVTVTSEPGQGSTFLVTLPKVLNQAS